MEKPVLKMLYALLNETSDCVGKTIEAVIELFKQRDTIYEN